MVGNGGNPVGSIQSHTWLWVTDVCRRENQPKQLKWNENCSKAGEKLCWCSHTLRKKDLLPGGGLGLFFPGWEGWRRKGEHRSVIRALKNHQRRPLSSLRSQMFYKMGLKKKIKTFTLDNSCVISMVVAAGLKLLPVCPVVCKIEYYEQMKYCGSIYMRISKAQKQKALLLVYNQNAVADWKKFVYLLQLRMSSECNETSGTLGLVPCWLMRNNPYFSMLEEIMYKNTILIIFFMQAVNNIV